MVSHGGSIGERLSFTFKYIKCYGFTMLQGIEKYFKGEFKYIKCYGFT